MKINEYLKIEPAIEEKVFSVSEFLDVLNKSLRPHWAIVRGEIGKGISSYPNYTFFNLLDKAGSILKCFAFGEVIKSLGISLKEGLEVKVFGYPEIRKQKGEMKFQVQRIELIGEGVLKKQFEILKKKLTALRYFDSEFKKSIPRFPQNIGLITSKYGKGAKKDFLTHLGNFGFKIFFYDVRVEGMRAISEVKEAINWFNENLPQIDVLVLTRGGGDWESLQSFNSEEMVRTIFSSKIPIITGIGHEADETLADFVADFRASTPTDAAKILNESWKLASENIFEFEKNLTFFFDKILKSTKEQIYFIRRNLTSELSEKIILKQRGLDNLERNFSFYFQNYLKNFEFIERGFKSNLSRIKILINREKLKAGQSLENLDKNKNFWREKIKELLIAREEKLALSNPSLKLKQGYSITRDKSGKIIKKPGKLKINQLIKTQFYKGAVSSRVKEIYPVK